MHKTHGQISSKYDNPNMKRQGKARNRLEPITLASSTDSPQYMFELNE